MTIITAVKKAIWIYAARMVNNNEENVAETI